MPNNPTPAAVRAAEAVLAARVHQQWRIRRGEYAVLIDREIHPLVEALLKLAHLNPHDEQWCWCALDYEDSARIEGEPERHQDCCLKARAAYSRATEAPDGKA